MREIKFRAFNTIENKWMYSSTFGLGAFWVGFEDGQYGIEVGQYTGLKDKNGKEIYEGDILEYKTNYKPYKCVIEWSDELGSCGCCYPACNSVGFVGKILPGSEYSTSGLASDYNKMEIIGNIHENPELLND